MGYYTDYIISWSGSCSKDEDERILQDLQDLSKEEFENYGECEYSTYSKWYNAKEDTLSLSRKYPYIFFTLEGWGSEDGDIWRIYIRDGKHQFTAAKIVFEDYSPDKMVE